MSRSPDAWNCSIFSGARRPARDAREHGFEIRVVERFGVRHREEIAVDPTDRRLSHLQVDVRGAKLHSTHEETIEIHRLERGIGRVAVFL
jgi:hypothetical protein